MNVDRSLDNVLEALDQCRVDRDALRAQLHRVSADIERERRAWDTHQAELRARLERIAQRHANDGHGQCSYCWDNLGMDGDRRPFPCPDYRDATGWAEP